MANTNPDTGTVVIALGVDRESQSFREVALDVRRLDRSYETNIAFTLRGMDADAPDFATASETGVIWTKALPAGEYEISNVVGDAGTFWWEKERRTPTTVHFTVVAGVATYIGHFRVEGGSATSSQIALSVSDANGADLARARSKNPGLGDIAVALAGSDAVTTSAESRGALASQ